MRQFGTFHFRYEIERVTLDCFRSECFKMDQFARYKIPPPVVKWETNKTVIVNIADISKAVMRPEHHILKFLSYELATASNESKKSLNGLHGKAVIKPLIDRFVDKFVTCGTCSNPETIMHIRKHSLRLVCKACGQSTFITDHKLVGYIFKSSCL